MKKLNALFYLSILFLITACNSSKIDNLEGRYRYVDPSMAKMIWRQFIENSSTAIGNELLLNRDSTFVYKTCGKPRKGIWTHRNDSLFLYTTSIYNPSDSLCFSFEEEKAKITPSKKPQGFLIKPHKLMQRELKPSKKEWITLELVPIY